MKWQNRTHDLILIYKFQKAFIVLALAITGVLCDVSHLDVHSSSHTDIQEDGYHYDRPSKPFPVS